jgi:hypothetical protein
MKYIFWVALVVAVVGVAGQIVVAGYTSMVFQDDLRELTVQLCSHLGLAALTSEEELREDVIHKASEHGIRLDPKQLTVRISGPLGHRDEYVAVRYTMPVNLVVGSFNLHFAASSSGVTY